MHHKCQKRHFVLLQAPLTASITLLSAMRKVRAMLLFCLSYSCTYQSDQENNDQNNNGQKINHQKNNGQKINHPKNDDQTSNDQKNNDQKNKDQIKGQIPARGDTPKPAHGRSRRRNGTPCFPTLAPISRGHTCTSRDGRNRASEPTEAQVQDGFDEVYLSRILDRYKS